MAKTKSVEQDINITLEDSISINEFIDKDYMEYSLYVLKQRAIPSYIDGFKVVHRKLICAALDNVVNKKIKVAELGSSLSSYGYGHGEVSAQDALTKMAATWNNNLPLFEEHGNFGSRIIQEPAAARYIYVKLADNFHKYFHDFEVCVPKDDNPEPINYLPIIPMCLVNGISGMAIGFATNILPRNPDDVRKACIEYLETRTITTPINVQYPKFNGIVSNPEHSKWQTEGIITKEVKGRKIIYKITELPINYDREKYYNVLLKLKTTEKITDFDEKCDKNGFNFEVYVDEAIDKKIDDPLKYFKLRSMETENLTTIDENGNLKIFNSVEDVIKAFCDYRVIKSKEMLDYQVAQLVVKISELELKLEFINKVISKEIVLNNLTKKDLITVVKKMNNDVTDEIADKIVGIPTYSFTQDNIAELEKQIKKQYTMKTSFQKQTGKTALLTKLKGVV
mgnify:FL=1